MKEPLVSICIPNYNYGKYLNACVQSALGQTYENKEVILVDDSSTDNSLEIAERYRSDIHIFRNPTNLGQPQSTNKAVQCSSGKYLVILHSDDLLLPHFIEKMVQLLEAHPNVGLAVGERMETDEAGIPTKVAPFYNTNCIIPGEKQAKVFMMTSFLPCQVLVRRKTFEKAGGVNNRYIVNLDGLLWFKCSLINDVGYIQEPVCVYRTHDENTTSQYNRSIVHMMEYYCTLSEMFRLSKDRPYLNQFFNAAIRRVGELTLRYCHGVFRSKNFTLAKQYLSLALAFDPGLEHNHNYQALRYCATSVHEDPFILYERLVDTITPEKRTFSYDPPDGSFPIA